MMYKNLCFFSSSFTKCLSVKSILCSLVFSFSVSIWGQTGMSPQPYYPPSEAADALNEERFKYQKEQDREAKAEREEDREYQREQEQLDRIRQAEEDRIRAEQEARREAEQALEDARREEERKNRQWEDREKRLKEKCEDLDDDLYQTQLDKRDTLRGYEDDFYELEEEINTKKSELTEKKIELDKTLDDLRRQSNEAIQRLKDQMKGQLEGLDGQIRGIEGAIDGIADEFVKLQVSEMDLFNAKQKSQNEAYIKCYELAQTNMLKKIDEYKQRANVGRLRRSRMSELFEGDSGSTSQQFNAMFERELNRCVNSEMAQRMSANQENDFQVMQEKIELQRNTLDEKREKLKEEIEKLNTNKRVEVLNDFKERMETILDEFERSHDRASKEAKQRKEHFLKEIDSIKQRQARLLSRREEEMNIDARMRQKVDECNKEQMLNLFKTNKERQQAWMEQRQRQQQQILQNQQRQIEGLMRSRSNASGNNRSGAAAGGSLR